MKKNIEIFFVCVTLCFGCSLKEKENSINNVSINEDIEWSHSWITSNHKNDLPKLLVIGDSHVEEYYSVVAQKMKNKAYCSKFTTSRSCGDPLLIEQLKAVVNVFKFDIITFNNGLHGVDYSDIQYKRGLQTTYELLSDSNPNAKIVLVSTTARRESFDLDQLQETNSQVINRNMIVEKFAKEQKVSLVDFYSLSFKHPEYYTLDGIHFNQKGVKQQADKISLEILKSIN